MTRIAATSDALPPPLEATFRALAQSENQAAVETLTAALDSPRRAIVERAVGALLARREDRGPREIVRRWHALDDRCRALAAERPGRMTRALRDAILSGDSLLRKNACHAAQALDEYDVMAALLALAESDQSSAADLAAGVALDLAQGLYDELGGRRESRQYRDPQRVRVHALGALEQSVARFARHRRREVVKAFLILVSRDDAALRRILQDPGDACHATALEILGVSAAPGVVRLALSFFDDPFAPAAALRVIAARADEAFLTRLLEKIADGASPQTRACLRRVESLPWLSPERLLKLAGRSQAAALELACLCGLDAGRLWGLLRAALLHGEAATRCLAVERLGAYPDAETDRLIMAAAEDNEPQVRAAAVRQLRQRGAPGAVDTVVLSLDSVDQCVRAAAQESLSDITFAKLLASFEMLDDAARRNAATLVRKIDPLAVDSLRSELGSPVRTRRLRALEIAVAMDAVGSVQDRVIELLQTDADSLVRAGAAQALGSWDTPRIRQALREARLDRSVAVQQAAEAALAAFAQSLRDAGVQDWEAPLDSWTSLSERA